MGFPVMAAVIGAGLGALYTKASGGSNRDMIKNALIGATVGTVGGTIFPKTLGGGIAGITPPGFDTIGAATPTGLTSSVPVKTGLVPTLKGLSTGKQLALAGAAVSPLLMMGGGAKQQGMLDMPDFDEKQYALAKQKADEQVRGTADRFTYTSTPQTIVDSPIYTLAKGGIVDALPKYNEGGVNYLPSKIENDENDTNNYVRAKGYVEDGSGIGNKDKDTMLAQLADGEFVSRADAVLGAGIMQGANPKDFKDMRKKGADFFYKQQSQLKRIYDMVS
tara:strand:+ start:4071 stop:4901 length:831 start_codon:yes stop_codon:yes gene_type:complete